MTLHGTGRITRFFILAILAVLPAAFASAATVEDVEASFYPYKNTMPCFEGLSPGMSISATNVDHFKDIIDIELFRMIKDGWFEMKVGATTSFDLHPGYVAATSASLGKVSLGADVGQINGFVAGRAFPEAPRLSDPRAGEKLAWNFKYGFNWGDGAAIYPLYSTYRDITKNKIERTLIVNFHVLNLKHRITQPPTPDITPNPSNLFRVTYLQVLEPYDVQNTQLLIQRAEDDLKLDNAWMYLGFQRRVRRLATGQTTDAFLGSDVMIEDFEGYNGRICDMKWTFKGTRNLLLPFYNHNDLALDSQTHLNDPEGYQVVAFGGKGGCYPNITWQLRIAHEVEAVPTDTNHPISKRIYYLDAQTFSIPRTSIYDRGGKLWKLHTVGQTHPDHHLPRNSGSGVAINDFSSMIDVQANHCTTGQFKGIVDPSLCPVDKFTVQNLRASGN
jgi:hypothetical protein